MSNPSISRSSRSDALRSDHVAAARAPIRRRLGALTPLPDRRAAASPRRVATCTRTSAPPRPGRSYRGRSRSTALPSPPNGGPVGTRPSNAPAPAAPWQSARRQHDRVHREAGPRRAHRHGDAAEGRVADAASAKDTFIDGLARGLCGDDEPDEQPPEVTKTAAEQPGDGPTARHPYSSRAVVLRRESAVNHGHGFRCLPATVIGFESSALARRASACATTARRSPGTATRCGRWLGIPRGWSR